MIIGWDNNANAAAPPPLSTLSNTTTGVLLPPKIISSKPPQPPPQQISSSTATAIQTNRRGGAGQPSLTSSTRSVMSNYSTDEVVVTESDLEGLVVSTTTDPGTVDDAPTPSSPPNDDTTSLDISAGGGYISSASASASMASHNPHHTPLTMQNASNSSVNATKGIKGRHHQHHQQHHHHHAKPKSSAIRTVSENVDVHSVLQAIEGLKGVMEKSLGDMRESTRHDLDRVLAVVQQETIRRTALEGRLHSQLLLQSETMVAMELKLLRLEAKVHSREAAQRQRTRQVFPGGSAAGSSVPLVSGPGHLPPISTLSPAPNTIDEEDDLGSLDVLSHPPRDTRSRVSGTSTLVSRGPPAAVVSSGASLASAVTATSFLDGEVSLTQINDEDDDDDGGSSDDGDVEDEGDGMADNHEGSAATPNQFSRSQFTTLDSILLNPIISSAVSEHGASTRATRGDMDGGSSLATSVTSATQPSTVVTATTRGDSITNNPRATTRSMASMDSGQDHHEEGSTPVVMVSGVANRSRRENFDAMFGLSSPPEDRPRSRSQSPLTVQSAATESLGPRSVASMSLGGSILSTAAVAPSRAFGTRRAAAAAAAAAAASGDNRSLSNRVVSFTSSEILADTIPAISEAGDSITMPDELDNLSDVADAFASSSRLWREEYESRLDAIQKKWGGD